jgi:hypothetical protein
MYQRNLSDKAWDLLHELRLRGFIPTRGIAVCSALWACPGKTSPNPDSDCHTSRDEEWIPGARRSRPLHRA